MLLLQEPGAAAAYGSVLDYPLHPSTLQQLQRAEPATDWAEASTRALWACAAAVAALQLDAAQDAALAAAAAERWSWAREAEEDEEFGPPPRLRIEMDESVRSSRERVPTWVGRSRVGGGRRVYLGSQRMAEAVVS